MTERLTRCYIHSIHVHSDPRLTTDLKQSCRRHVKHRNTTWFGNAWKLLRLPGIVSGLYSMSARLEIAPSFASTVQLTPEGHIYLADIGHLSIAFIPGTTLSKVFILLDRSSMS